MFLNDSVLFYNNQTQICVPVLDINVHLLQEINL